MPPSAYTKQTGRVSLVGLDWFLERKAAASGGTSWRRSGRWAACWGFLCEDEGELEGAVSEGRVMGA